MQHVPFDPGVGWSHDGWRLRKTPPAKSDIIHLLLPISIVTSLDF